MRGYGAYSVDEDRVSSIHRSDQVSRLVADRDDRSRYSFSDIISELRSQDHRLTAAPFRIR